MRKIVFIGRWMDSKEISGIHRYTIELLKSLDKIVADGEVELLIPSCESCNYSFKHIKVIQLGHTLPLPGKLRERVTCYLFKNLYFYAYVRRHRAISVDTLLQFPLFGCDVIAIYDCRVNRFPEYYSFSSQWRRIHRVLLRHQQQAVKHCKMIITDSKSAANDIHEYYGEAKPIEVNYCGWQHFMDVQEDERVLEKLNLKKGNYFFSLGSRFPHKNIKWVSNAARLYPQYTFVLSGAKRGGGDFSFEGDSAPNMVFAGRLCDAEVKSLMRHCKAFIQPSLYEGFGIPPLEAMSVGADCIVSDIPVFREIYGNSVWYMNPVDYDHIDLNAIMAQPKDSNDTVLEAFSWDNCARIFLEAVHKRFGK